MWEIISAAILCLFATFGFVAFIKALIFKIYKPQNENAYLIINYKDECDDIEYTLRSWQKRAQWLGKAAPDNIIIIDSGLSKEQKEICRLIINESEMFKIMNSDELLKLMQKDYIKR